MITFSYLIAQADAGSEAASTVAIETLMDFILKGGVMMIPIGLCSLVALAVFIEPPKRQAAGRLQTESESALEGS